MEQARSFIAYANKVTSTDAFDRWAASKDFGREDRRAISGCVAYLLARGESVARPVIR